MSWIKLNSDTTNFNDAVLFVNSLTNTKATQTTKNKYNCNLCTFDIDSKVHKMEVQFRKCQFEDCVVRHRINKCKLADMFECMMKGVHSHDDIVKELNENVLDPGMKLQIKELIKTIKYPKQI